LLIGQPVLMQVRPETLHQRFARAHKLHRQ
jgi:hypothetical protein